MLVSTKVFPCLVSIALIAQAPGFASSANCGLPLSQINGQPNYVIGNGTPGSCTETDLTNALNVGGLIKFNCGPGPVTIPITYQHEFRNDMDTVLDGGGSVTLLGNGNTRLLVAHSGDGPWYGGTAPWWMSTRTTVTLQNITLSGGRSSGTPIPPPPSNVCSQGTDLDGGGGAIDVRDMVLHVYNSTFTNNHAAPLGPDVAGGAIYAWGSVDVTIQGSTFTNNDGSNGGAVGVLDTDLTSVNNTFSGNRALGHDGNHNVPSSGCPVRSNQNQIGSGGNAGAIYIDAQVNRGSIFCGTQILNNTGGSNADGGGIFFGGLDPGLQRNVVVFSEIDGNYGSDGGGLYAYGADLLIVGDTFNANRADHGGAIQLDQSHIVAVNDTFANNYAAIGVGALAAFSGSYGIVVNDTFAGNSSPYFPITFPGDSGTPRPDLTFTNNIFVNNTATGWPLPCNATFPGWGNVLWPPSSMNPAPQGACAAGNALIDPQLAPLADNGGGVQTMALPASNPAASQGVSNCPSQDQRQVGRPGVCSAGAYQP